MPRTFAVAALLLAGSVAACSSTPEPPPNVVVVVADTLRADRLGAYGNPRGLTPFLDTLAERGALFRSARATCSWTNPSVASILTSRHPYQHGIMSFTSTLQDDELTLAEALQRRGYATAGFSANYLINTELGFAQGFDRYSAVPVVEDGKPTSKRAGEITAEALAWLDQLPHGAPAKPVFLYLQYMEPHVPYRPSSASLAHVFGDRPQPSVQQASAFAFVGNMTNPLDPVRLAATREVYDATVHTLDESLRTLFHELERRGILEHALVIVTADHGQEFGDHGNIGHGYTLFGEVLHVPLLVLAPGRPAPAEIAAPVSLVDLAPTILDWVGGAAPPSFTGRSLRPLIERRTSWTGWLRPAPAPQPLLAELTRTEELDRRRRSPHTQAVILGSHKLIAGIDGEREYYDLAADPAERAPDALTAAQRATLEDARVTLLAAAATQPAQPAAIDDATRDRMRALGYE